MSKTIAATLVLSATTGLIDQAATVRAFEATLANHVASHELETETIREAVSAVFASYAKGVSINLPALKSFVCNKLNAKPANFESLGERVLDYVRANSQGKTAEDGSVERPDSMFVIAKGKGGGARLRADMPVKA